MVYWKLQDALAGLRAYSQILVRIETAPAKSEGPAADGRALVAGAATLSTAKGRSHYEIFDSPAAIYARIVAAPREVSFHEITRTRSDPFPPPLRLYFDVDCKREAWSQGGSGRDIEWRACLAFHAAAKKWSEDNGLGSAAAMRVASSSDYTSKVSLHIFFPGLVFSDYRALGRAAVVIASYLEPWLANTVDQVYKKNQGLRLLWAHKAGTDRTKRPYGPAITWPTDPIQALAVGLIHDYAATIPYPGNLLDDLVPPVGHGFLGAENHGDLSLILEALAAAEWQAAERAGDGHPPEGGAYREQRSTFLDNGGTILNLLRIAPSFCIVCGRTHDSENPYIRVRGGVYRFHCRRAEEEGRKSVVIMEDPDAREQAREAAAAAREVAFRPPTPVFRVNSLSDNPYAEDLFSAARMFVCEPERVRPSLDELTYRSGHVNIDEPRLRNQPVYDTRLA
jgi:hypothetical protein